MNKVEIRKKVTKIFDLIYSDNFLEARILINELYELNDKNINNNIDYIKSILDESEEYSMKDQQEKQLVQQYVNDGKKYLYHEEYYYAYQTFRAGAYLTRNPIFRYYCGLACYKMKDYKNAKSYFQSYEKVGYGKLRRCYFYLARIYSRNKNTKTLAAICSNRYNKLESVHKGDLNPCNYRTPSKIIALAESNELYKSMLEIKNINELNEKFKELTETEKIEFLYLAYKTGHIAVADSLFKKYSSKIQKENKREFETLNKNIKIYRKQAKS